MPSRFRRFLLPGFAFKAVVIGGGYATGRELATFFLPSGPQGGIYAMLLATVIWSAVCVVTFLFARQTASLDYRSFFRQLLGPFWPTFEIAYFFAVVLMVAVFSAAAGAIGRALFGWPDIVGTLALIACITVFVTLGNYAVEQLFKYVSFFLYGMYVVFVVLSFTHFGTRIVNSLATAAPTTGWVSGGVTYAGYNILGAVVILPMLRFMTSRKDALIAGALAGPLAMLPALLFFMPMAAFYPEIMGRVLPSDYLLEQLHMPAFRFLFQAMIFSALLESGTGAVHAINERIAFSYQSSAGKLLSKRARLAIALAILTGSAFAAQRFGLVTLIANGYRWLAYAFLGLYVLPVMTLGLWRVWTGRTSPLMATDSSST